MDPRFNDNHWHGQGSGRRRGGPEGGGDGRRGGRGRFGGGRGGFGLGMPPMGRGPRRDRGDVRAAVLMLLTERPMHGYEIIQEIAERSDEAWKPSPGAIYPTLQLLQDEGLLTSDDTEGKKVFALTETGRETATELGATRTAPWDDASAGVGDRHHTLHRATFQLVSATREILMAGTDDQQKRATEVLADARRKLYAMLAEDAE